MLLFSKLPEVGKVKTRLTVLKDGVFQPEVASALYHCMLFDVVEIMCAALDDLEAASRAAVEAGEADVLDTYELVISRRRRITSPPWSTCSTTRENGRVR